LPAGWVFLWSRPTLPRAAAAAAASAAEISSGDDHEIPRTAAALSVFHRQGWCR
jgi:hypothetical protein